MKKIILILVALVVLQHWFLWWAYLENHRLEKSALSLADSFNRADAAFEEMKAANEKLLGLNNRLLALSNHMADTMEKAARR